MSSSGTDEGGSLAWICEYDTGGVYGATAGGEDLVDLAIGCTIEPGT